VARSQDTVRRNPPKKEEASERALPTVAAPRRARPALGRAGVGRGRVRWDDSDGPTRRRNHRRDGHRWRRRDRPGQGRDHDRLRGRVRVRLRARHRRRTGRDGRVRRRDGERSGDALCGHHWWFGGWQGHRDRGLRLR
jgi:hypothetical protein